MCGRCCTGKPGVVWVDESEIAAIAAHLGESPEEVRGWSTRAIDHRRSLRETSGGECVFYDRATGCTVYATRPRQCRTWPFWDSNVETPEAWERTSELCPGAGPLYPAAEIDRLRRVIKV
jgi:Fe-S-cluster containining protein